MSTYSTYSDIVTEVQNALAETGQDFVDYIPTAIGLATDRLVREVNLLAVKTDKDTVTTTIGNRIASKPTDWRFTKDLFLVRSDGTEVKLDKKTDDYIRDFWPDSSVTGEPIYYGEWSDTEVILAPTPDQVYDLEYTYAPEITPVSSTNATNIFTDKCPDVYYKAILYELVLQLKLYSQASLYENDYRRSLAAINNQGRKEMRDDDTPANIPEPNQNETTE